MGIVVTILVGLAAVACFINPVWGLCAYIATIIIRPNEMVQGVKLPSTLLMLVCMSLSYLAHMSRATHPKSGPRSLSEPLLVLMILLLAVHFIIMPSGLPLLDWILSEAAPTLLLLFFFTRHMTTPRRLQAGLTTMSASSAVIALDALSVHFLRRGAPVQAETDEGVLYPGYGELWNSYHLSGMRLTGKGETMWGNSNDLGMITNWGILGCLFYLRRKGSNLLRLAALGLMGLMAATLVLTGSRGGQLQLGINLWLVFVGGKRKALGVVLLLLAVVGALVVLPRLAPQRADAGESKDERTELLFAGLRLFKSYPVQGAGYMRFPDRNDFKSLLPHNVYVQALAETGLVGVLIFFPLMFYLRRETSRAVKHFNSSGVDPPAPLLATCIGALQFSYSVFILFSNQFMTYRFGLVMTLAMGLYRAMLIHRDGLEGDTTSAEETEGRSLPDSPQEG